MSHWRACYCSNLTVSAAVAVVVAAAAAVVVGIISWLAVAAASCNSERWTALCPFVPCPFVARSNSCLLLRVRRFFLAECSLRRGSP